jgi:hypothetical protein
MPTNIAFGAQEPIKVQEDAESVLRTLEHSDGYARFTLLHHAHNTPTGSVWVNPAQVRFVNELGG